MTTPKVNPYTFDGNTKAKRPSTRQLLGKISNYPCLYRHANGTYYGIKKMANKHKVHSLDTKDRKIAERTLKSWIADLEKIDTEAAKTTLAQLIERFTEIRKGKSDSTKTTEAGIIKSLKANWKHGMDSRQQVACGFDCSHRARG